MMPSRPLGSTGVSTSILGFGVSGAHGGLAPPALTARMIAMAREAGVTWFDTAPFYGDAESRLGQALSPSESVVLVSSKVGKNRRGLTLENDFSPAGVRASVEGSLRRLRRDCLDIVFLHGPSVSLAADEALANTLDALKSSGHVRWVGICGRGDEIDAFVATGQIDVVQAPLAKAACAQAARCAFVAIEVLRGAKRSGAPPGFGDLWRAGQFAASLARGAARPIAAAQVANQALWAAWATPGVDCVMTTTTHPEHMRHNVEAARAWTDV